MIVFDSEGVFLAKNCSFFIDGQTIRELCRRPNGFRHDRGWGRHHRQRMRVQTGDERSANTFTGAGERKQKVFEFFIKIFSKKHFP